MQEDFYSQIFSGVTKGLISGILISLKSFWYLWLLLIVVFFIKTAISLLRLYKIRKAGLPEIDKMSGTDFEIYMEGLFNKLGYKVERVGKMADYGADLVIEKNGIRTAVQAKRWDGPVSVKAIQEINTAMAHYNASKAVAVTNSRFTYNATRLARENHVELIDRQKLASLILQKK